MSVIVSGMEMPEHCGYCRFRYDGICHALQKTQYSMEDCPLVPVPPHGRLIDADDIDYPLMESEADEKWMHIAIDSAPTVIEAEEGEAVRQMKRF